MLQYVLDSAAGHRRHLDRAHLGGRHRDLHRCGRGGRRRRCDRLSCRRRRRQRVGLGRLHEVIGERFDRRVFAHELAERDLYAVGPLQTLDDLAEEQRVEPQFEERRGVARPIEALARQFFEQLLDVGSEKGRSIGHDRLTQVWFDGCGSGGGEQWHFHDRKRLLIEDVGRGGDLALRFRRLDPMTLARKGIGWQRNASGACRFGS